MGDNDDVRDPFLRKTIMYYLEVTKTLYFATNLYLVTNLHLPYAEIEHAAPEYCMTLMGVDERTYCMLFKQRKKRELCCCEIRSTRFFSEALKNLEKQVSSTCFAISSGSDE